MEPEQIRGIVSIEIVYLGNQKPDDVLLEIRSAIEAKLKMMGTTQLDFTKLYCKRLGGERD